MADFSELLCAAGRGEQQSIEQLMTLMYPELRQLAHRRMMMSPQTALLQTTALVNESYLRLVAVGRLSVTDRSHFLAYAARVMRSVIVDHARQRQAARRGSGAEHVSLDSDVAEEPFAPEEQIGRVNEALEALASIDTRLAQIVEMRYFGGFTENEIAVVLGVHERTVRRDWQKARALLSAALD